MAKIDRMERLDAQRVDLEAEYRAKLVAALKEAAAGKWGLFGHNEHLFRKAALPTVVAELRDLGEEIDAMRDRLMLEPFALHAEFMASRGRVSAQAVGEPKQARAWLERLSAQ